MKLKIWGALIVLASQVANAQTNSDFNISTSGSKTFDLTISKAKGDVEFFLRDENRELIYKNTVATFNGSLRKSYDLSHFPDGQYLLELTDDERSTSLPVVIKDDILKIELDKKRVSFLPSINQKDQIVSVNMMALNDEDLSVTIINSVDEVVYQETLSGNINLGKIFDFSSTLPGDYEFRLFSNQKLVTKAITIK